MTMWIQGITYVDPSLAMDAPIDLCECYTDHIDIGKRDPCANKATTIVRNTTNPGYMVCCDFHRDRFKIDFPDAMVTFETVMPSDPKLDT